MPQDLPDPCLHVMLGTKAQYIKMSPILVRLQDEGRAFNLVDLGQHAELSPELSRDLGIRKPDLRLFAGRTISTLPQAARWFLGHLGSLLFRPGRVRREAFLDRGGICLIHGDTPSTLLALLYAKRAGLDVAHVEAGLTSGRLLRPFPEEIIRRICTRWSDYLITFSDGARSHLEKRKSRGRIFDAGQNTNVEALYRALARQEAADGAGDDAFMPQDEYCVMTMHRVETLYSRHRLEQVVEIAERLARDWAVFFVLHEPTRARLGRRGLLGRLEENPSIHTSPILPHTRFVSILAGAAFVITDGGSIQEECAYLDLPCLVMRSETERQDGLGKTARLGHFDFPTLEHFLDQHAELATGVRELNHEPSARILDFLDRMLADQTRDDLSPQDTPARDQPAEGEASGPGA